LLKIDILKLFITRLVSILYLFYLKRKLNKLWLVIKNVNFKFGILRDSKGLKPSLQIIISKKLIKIQRSKRYHACFWCNKLIIIQKLRILAWINSKVFNFINQRNGSTNCQKILIGNKVDLSGKRVISE